MNHSTTPEFWQLYNDLPKDVRDLADKCFLLLKADANHPSLRFKKIHEVWSARVGLHYRALAEERLGGFVWYWIGTYAEYDDIIG